MLYYASRLYTIRGGYDILQSLFKFNHKNQILIWPHSIKYGRDLFISNLISFFRFGKPTPNSVDAGRYTIISDNALNYDKKWPLEMNCAASGQLQIFVMHRIRPFFLTDHTRSKVY